MPIQHYRPYGSLSLTLFSLPSLCSSSPSIMLSRALPFSIFISPFYALNPLSGEAAPKAPAKGKAPAQAKEEGGFSPIAVPQSAPSHCSP